MIYNITENAVKYNKENGNVTIWVGNTLEGPKVRVSDTAVSYTHLRAHETVLDLVCRLLLAKKQIQKKKKNKKTKHIPNR